MDWKFIEPNKDYSLEEKIAYTEGCFNTLCQIHSNLELSNDEEFDSLNIEIRKYMSKLKKKQNEKSN